MRPLRNCAVYLLAECAIVCETVPMKHRRGSRGAIGVTRSRLVKVEGGMDGCAEEGLLRRKQVADPLAERIPVDGDDVVAAHHGLVAV